MLNIFKIPLVLFGGMLIGLGIGIIFGNFLISESTKYWLSVIISLVLGGFLLASGLMTKKQPKEKIIEKEEDSNLQNSDRF